MGLLTNAIHAGNVQYLDTSTYIGSNYTLGDGDNVVKIMGSGNTVTTGNGDNSIKVSGDANTVVAGNGGNVVQITGDSNSAALGNGNNTISVNGDTNTVISGDGNNVVTYRGNNALIYTGNGDDEVEIIGDYATVFTNGGNDNITSIGSNSTISTGDGDDSLLFWGDDNTISMGSGDDTVITYDNIFKETGLTGSDIEEAFLSGLRTGTWSKWTEIMSKLIDVKKKKSTFKTKITYTYQDYYMVMDIYSQYMDGCKNTKIDRGSGSDTAVVNLAGGSRITAEKDGTDNITKTKKWQTNTVVSTREASKIRKETKTKRSWSGLGKKVLGTLMLPCGIGVFIGTNMIKHSSSTKTMNAGIGTSSSSINTSSTEAYASNLVGKYTSDTKYTGFTDQQADLMSVEVQKVINGIIAKA